MSGDGAAGGQSDGERPRSVERRIQEQLTSRDLHGAAETGLRSYGPEILGFLARVMDGENDASEVFSQFCEDLWRGLADFQGRSSFRTWAYRLARRARNRFLEDPYRRYGRRLQTSEISKIEQQVRSETPIYLKTDAKDRFAELQQRLKPGQREILILRLDRKMSWLEIAQILSGDGSSQDLHAKAAALRQRFRRLKLKLRDMFKEEGLL